MKLFKLKRKNIILVSLLAIAGFLGISSVAVNHAVKDTPVAEKAEAATSNVTNGHKRINVFVSAEDSKKWIWDGSAKIQFKTGGSGVGANKTNFTLDTDLGTETKSNTRKMTIAGGTYYVGTYDFGSSYPTTTWWNVTIGRSNTTDNDRSTSNKDGQSGVWYTAYNSMFYWGDATNFNSQADLFYYKVAFHTGLNLETVSYNLVNAKNYAPSDPATTTIDGYHFAGWYTNSDLADNHKYTTQTLTGDINLYAKYVKTGYYLVGDSNFMTSIGKTGQATWNYQTGLLMDAPLAGNDKAVSTVQLNSGSKFKVYNFYGDGSTNSYATIAGSTKDIGRDGDGNYSITSKKWIDIYVNNDKQSWASSGTAGRHTVTYKFVVDGVAQDKINTVTINDIDVGKKFDDLDEPALFGYEFNGWYFDDSLSIGIADHYINFNGSTHTVCAKFSSEGSSTTIFADIPNTYYDNLTTSSDDVYYTYVKIWDNSNSVFLKIKEVNAISVDGNKFFRVNIPSGATGFLFDKDGVDGSAKYQTIDFHIGTGNESYSNGHNVVLIKDGSTHLEGTWLDVLFYLEICTDTTFAANKTTTYNMTQPEDSSTGNMCEIMNVVFPANNYLRIMYKVFYSDNTVTKYHKIANGEDSVTDSSKWTYIENVSGNNTGVHNKSGVNKTVNIYVVGSGSEYGRMYFVDCSGVVAAGYLYVSTQLSPSQLKIDCSVNSVSKFSAARVSTITSVESTDNVGFNGIEGMIKIPLFNLKKAALNAGDSFSIQLNSTADTKSATINFSVSSSTGNNYIVYLDTGAASWGSVTAYTTNTDAAKAAFDIAKAISSAKSQSVCLLDQATAIVLKDEYNVSGVSDLLTSNLSKYYVDTWARSVEDEGAKIGFAPIYVHIQSIADTGAPAALGIRSFSPYDLFGSEDNFSTIIIIVSSSVALLSVTALSILVIRKRKSKEN